MMRLAEGVSEFKKSFGTGVVSSDGDYGHWSDACSGQTSEDGAAKKEI